MNVTLTQAMELLSQLSVDEQMQAYRSLVQMIKHGYKAESAKAGASFKIGQVVRFATKSRGIKFLKIEKFNRAGTCVVGYECDHKGKQLATKVRWTVDNTSCTAV